MHIQSVQMKDCAFSPETGQFRATLLMQDEKRRISLRTATTYEQGMRRSDLARCLLEDALRQLRQMPEFRNSNRQITVAEEALPHPRDLRAAA